MTVFFIGDNYEIAYSMPGTISGGSDSADDAGANCGANASPTADARQTGRKTTATWFRVDSGMATLGWQTVRVYAGTMGAPAPAQCLLGSTYLD